jgi:hypothetical protein
MEWGKACTGFWLGNLKERDQWEDPGIDGEIILRWSFSKWDVEVWTGLSWLRSETDWQAFLNAVMNLRVP